MAPLGACLLALVGLLPWTTSGTVTRNAYETVVSARTILDDGAIRTIAGAYLFVPALAAGSVLATVLHRRAIAGVLALLAALAAMALLMGVSVSSVANPAGIVPTAVLVVATILAVMAMGVARVARPADPGDALGR